MNYYIQGSPARAEEIMTLIDWYLDKEIDEDNEHVLSFDSFTREGMEVEMRFVPSPQRDED